MTSKETSDIINGAVLAGGKSVRMGQDKGAIHWHGLAQRDYMATLLNKFCPATFISCREEQEINDSNYPLLVDTYTGMGPLGAILSAFEKNNRVAWLIVACDLPLLNEATIQYLVANRNKGTIATTFESPYDGLPEPLITIWEPAAQVYLLNLLKEGYKCPRKALMKSDNVTILKAPEPDALTNTNTPEEAERVMELLTKVK